MLDTEKHEVLTSDREYSIAWRSGAPVISVAVEKIKGQKQSIEFSATCAFAEEFKPGQVYNYRFNSAEMKKPIQNAVTESGWLYRRIVLGKW